MANADTPRGLVPIKTPHGTAIPVEYLKVTSTYTTDIAVGTPVYQTAAGFIQPVIVTTAASQKWVGVSMEYYDASEEGTKEIAVATDPNQMFLVQCSVSTGVAQALVGASAAFTTPSGVNTTTQLSTCEIGGYATTGSAPLRVIGLHKRSSNTWGANADVIVKPNPGSHQRGSSTPV